MGDILSTQDSTLYDVDGNPISSILDGGTRRLAVDAGGGGIITADVRTLGQKLSDENKMFIAAMDFITLAGSSEADIFLLKNPSASGKNVRIRDFIFVSSKAANPTTMRVYRNPTITANGTTITPQNLRDKNVASAMSTFKLPTISARGTLLQVFGLVGQAELRHDEFLEMFTLPGDNLLLTIEPNSANQSYAIDATWGEA